MTVPNSPDPLPPPIRRPIALPAAPRKPTPPAATGPKVLCPICMDEYPWPDNPQLYEYRDGNYVPTSASDTGGSVRSQAMLRNAYVRCPHPSGDLDAHYLPARYATFGKPLVIGLVGGSTSGKSHLLASMVGAIEADGLKPFGLTVRPLDFNQHAEFIDRTVAPLQSGVLLPSTRDQDTAVKYADALLLTSAKGKWPITFFDVSGGDLAVHEGNATRFLDVASGLLFVVDPAKALAPRSQRLLNEPAFATVLGKLGEEEYLDVPAAVVFSKADRYRFRPPVDRWLSRSPSRHVDAELLRQESRDVYGFLSQYGADPWLKPFHRCRRCTMHFASATGSEAVDGKSYPRGCHPRRVLEPLVALLAMCDVIAGSEAERVGRW